MQFSVNRGSSADKEYDTGGGNTPSSTSVDDSCFSLGCFLKQVVLPLVVLTVATSLVVYFVGGNQALPTSLQGILPDMELFRNEDPLMGEIYTWEPYYGNQGGLELTLLNCLDPEWHHFFEIAVEQWDNGTPDSLTLSTEVGSPDPACTRSMGVLKVCNGDYGGDAGWKGVNEVFLQNGYIVSSTAIMNEFFFSGANDDPKRQYTMCHEIGHGFGLPHTDERFWNRDSGNCMDYTSRPQNNMQPDILNFETLASVYGEIGGTRPPVVSTDTNEASTSPPSGNLAFPQPYQPNQESFEEKEKEYEDEADRRLRNIDESGFPALNAALFPAAVRHRLKEIDDFVNSGHLPTEGSEWRVLHEGHQGRALEMDLGEGFMVQLHFLLASDEDYPV